MQHPSAHARTAPDRPAVVIGDERLTFGVLDARSNQVARLLRATGIGIGDHVALLLENRTEFLEIVWGALRAGVHLTPINWHLDPAEAAYILDDCGASLLFGSGALLDTLGDRPALSRERWIGVDEGGGNDLASLLRPHPTVPVPDECEGSLMYYSSGTTGRPKGIKRAVIGQPLGEVTSAATLMEALYGFDSSSVFLSPAPLYHAAPSGWVTGAHRLGATAVVMERFDPEETLALIQRHRVTHVQFVPTHMVRLLKLPQSVRDAYDLSSLQSVIHAAAPCPPDAKRAFIDWVGTIVYEYYSGSEGVGFCSIDSHEWLAHPGSVGRSLMGGVHICDEAGTELPVGAEGQVWFEPPGAFEYHGDAQKTAEAFDSHGWATIGDVGRLDEDGYLYLTDRVSNMIISGGVNIYPREAEDVLIGHPAVADVAVVGVPHPEMGEAVRAIVEPASAVADADAFAAELVAFCRDHLSTFKCPTSVVLVDELPRLPSGKVSRRLLDEWLLAPDTGAVLVGRPARTG